MPATAWFPSPVSRRRMRIVGGRVTVVTVARMSAAKSGDRLCCPAAMKSRYRLMRATRLILPCAAGEGDRPKDGGGVSPASSRRPDVFISLRRLAPSTMLRTVPLPRFTGEDENCRRSGNRSPDDAAKSGDRLCRRAAMKSRIPLRSMRATLVTWCTGIGYQQGKRDAP